MIADIIFGLLLLVWIVSALFKWATIMWISCILLLCLTYMHDDME